MYKTDAVTFRAYRKTSKPQLAAVPVSNPVCLFSNVYFAFSSKHNSPFFEHFQCLWFPEFHHKIRHHHNKQLKYPSTTKLIVCKKDRFMISLLLSITD